MDYHTEEEDVYVSQRFGGEEIVVLVAETAGDGGWKSFHVRARAVDRVGEVLYDEFEVRECFGEGYAGVAIGPAELDQLKRLVNTYIHSGTAGKECNVHRQQ